VKYLLKTYRFGTTNQDGTLDYGVHERSSEEFEATGKTLQELKIESAVTDEPLIRHNACVDLYESIPDDAKSRMNMKYSEMIGNVGTDRDVDLITVEFDDFVFVRYCRLGQWFSFAEKSRLGLSDQTRYGDKRNYFAVWDGKHWVRPGEYDLEPLSEDVVA